MREDPFIFRHDKRREAWGQYRAFLLCGAEYRLCRGNLLAQCRGRTLPFLRLRQSTFFNLVEDSTVVSNLLLYDTQFFLNRSLLRVEQGNLSLEELLHLPRTSMMLTALFLSQLMLDLRTLRDEHLAYLSRIPDPVVVPLPLSHAGPRLVFQSGQRGLVALERLHRLADVLITGLQRQQTG